VPPGHSRPPSNSAAPLDGVDEGGGCACTASGAPVPGGGLAIAIAGLVAFAVRRRKPAVSAEAD